METLFLYPISQFSNMTDTILLILHSVGIRQQVNRVEYISKESRTSQMQIIKTIVFFLHFFDDGFVCIFEHDMTRFTCHERNLNIAAMQIFDKYKFWMIYYFVQFFYKDLLEVGTDTSILIK